MIGKIAMIIMDRIRYILRACEFSLFFCIPLGRTILEDGKLIIRWCIRPKSITLPQSQEDSNLNLHFAGDDGYRISVASERKNDSFEIVHYKVQVNCNKAYSVDPSCSFTSMTGLITYYKGGRQFLAVTLLFVGV